MQRSDRKRGWRQFWAFSSLTLVLLALVPGLSLLTGVSMDFTPLARKASEATGIPWTSNLWDVVRLARVEPGLWLLPVGSLAPTLAALVVLAAGRDASAWREFARRWLPFGLSGRPVTSELASYALLIVVIPVCLLVAYLLRQWIAPGEFTRPEGLFSWSLLSGLTFAALLDQGAVLEEGGWRGFGQPLLQDRLVDPLRAAILVGLVWSLWHVPRDVVTGVIERLGLVSYLSLYLPSFTLGTVGVSVVAAWFVNRLGGSVIPAIMVHGLTNDSVGISGLTTIDRALTPDAQLTRALPTLVLAMVLVAVSGRQLRT